LRSTSLKTLGEDEKCWMAGHPWTGGAVSGSERVPVIDLRGSSMVVLAASTAAGSRLPQKVRGQWGSSTS
jgi:hypothetical protein